MRHTDPRLLAPRIDAPAHTHLGPDAHIHIGRAEPFAYLQTAPLADNTASPSPGRWPSPATTPSTIAKYGASIRS
ncbi:MAG: hypothetical protein ABMA14_24385 [Hyphomonadaceae bacterium]